MLKILLSSRSLIGLVVTSLAAAGYVAWFSGPEASLFSVAKKPQFVPVALETVLPEICAEITENLPEPRRVLRPVLVLSIAGDREGLFAGHLQEALNRQGWYRPVEKGIVEKVLDTAKEATGFSGSGSDDAMERSSSDLAALMKSAKAETLIRGSLDRLALPKNAPAEIRTKIELWEIDPVNPDVAICLFSGEFERPRPVRENIASQTQNGLDWGNLKVYALVVLLCAIWPWLTVPWMRAAIKDDSNTATLKVLLGITAIPAAIFVLFLWYRGHSVLDMVLQTLLLGLILFFYVALVMSKVQTRTR